MNEGMPKRVSRAVTPTIVGPSTAANLPCDCRVRHGFGAGRFNFLSSAW